MRQDQPRDRMPDGSVWNMVDWIPDLGAPGRKRGGTSYASPDISGVKATASYIAAVAYAPYSGGAKRIAIDEDGELYTVASSSSATDIGAAVVPLQTPVFHAQKLIIPANDGTTAPKYYDGTTLGDLAGSPPAAKYAAVYADYTVLANTNAKPTYLYFSGPADPTTWNTTTGFLSVSQPITGLAALPGALLVFMADQTARVTGAAAPPGTDMSKKDPLFNVGCSDARSIATYDQYAIFCNALGVWRSNGALVPEDMTWAAGLSNYWRDLMSAYASTWTIAGGVIRSYYVVSVMDGSTFKDAFMFDLKSSRAWRVSNFKFVGYAHAVGVTGEELYAASRAAPRVHSLTSIFAPAAGVKNDADGTAVTEVLESAFYTGKQAGRKDWRCLYFSFDKRDAASDNPTASISYMRNPEDGYTALGTLAETSNLSDPSRLWLGGSTGQGLSASGIAFKWQGNNASSDTRLYRVEAEVAEREAGRVQ